MIFETTTRVTHELKVGVLRDIKQTKVDRGV